MNSFLRALNKFDDIVAKGEGALLIVLVAAMTAAVFLQVFYRYFLAQPLIWTEEVARYLFVWISFIGTALGMKKGGHFGLDIFFNRLPPPARRFAGFLIYLLVGTVILVILVEGITLIQKTTSQVAPATGILIGYVYACLPIGAALMAVHLIVMILNDALKR